MYYEKVNIIKNVQNHGRMQNVERLTEVTGLRGGPKMPSGLGG